MADHPRADRAVPTTAETGSPWLTDRTGVRYTGPTTERHFDVLVLGGGITGLTTAHLLTQRGARVAVVEADRVASGATGNNTAKVTALQATMLSRIRSARGAEAAASYAEHSLRGVELVAATVDELGIDCDLRRRDACTIAADRSERAAVEKEFEAARAAGLPVEWTEETDLPFPVAGAVRLAGQVELHPVRYARALAAAVHGGGSAVFERTRAVALAEEKPVRVETTRGTLTGEQVVVATHYPVWDRGGYFARMQAVRAYCVAARVRGGPPRSLSITAGSPSWSYRSLGDQVIVCGQDHPAGERGVDRSRFGVLEEHLRRHFTVGRVTHRWSAQDALPYDHTPMIGTYTPVSSRVFVAAGYSKWGLSGGSAAAAVLAEQLAGGPGSPVFTPHRISPRALPTLARANARVALDLVGDRLRPGEAGSAAGIPAGEGRIVRSGTDRAGVYRDPDGGLHAVSVRCTHLGCLLRFNGAERSWDCPCHGSRFDVDGAVLEGPAVHPLERRPVPGASGRHT
ncbi:FAD-dependent oxidoreductase [Pseudonocardia sp. RS11V-5]|uniref:FAD-dependent oxidoreductase n=1 Tax=Pseudonocardia terrae TaxID=2905831 RepID=UPI001E45EBB9|nr:FAD-dependent oxidoreductase [Pseudonocardia terrae]MCE3555397.1 FAD-dependent oxidoreductase [Pseudonocardia terrae]